MTEYNVQQKQFIQEYKTRHHLENKSDEQIMLFIQKDMQTNGVVYPGFESLVKPQNKSAYTGQIFGNSTTSNDMAGIAIEHGCTTTATKEPEKEIITDENGNEVAVVKNGDEIVEATLSQTDSNGNKLETVVSYENGKPVKQIKKQNGNVSSVTKFTYNEPTENMPFQSVTVETIDGGKNKIITTALETDEYGNVDQEDFISRKTISKDGTETTVIIGSECIKEEKLKFDGKKVATLYNGTNLADFDNHKLHRIAQETEIDGVKRYAEYDGKGNTKTTVQNGESPALIAQKFNVKEQALMRLNPQKGKNAITQVGADILIPGEFNADSYPMRVRKSKAESLNKYSQFEARRLAKEINSGEVENVKLSKTYNNVYELAKDNLIKSGVKNLSNQQVNDEANKLILLNGKNVNLKAGASVKVAKRLTNSKQASELTKYGFQASAENRIFFKKFNALNPQQKQNVLSAIQYCKSQKITNPSDIKAKVLETLGINLFDSDKTVPVVADNNWGVMAYQRNSKPISIETFVKDHLKLNIKSEPGKTVLERLSQVEQTKLNKISAKDFKGFNNKTLDSVASMLETVGVQIRTQAEINVKNNTPRAKAEKEKRAVRTAAAENIALAYDNAINVIKNYQGNQGWMNVAFYREKLGQLLDKVNPTDVATCFDAVVKRLEKEKQFAVSRLKTASANESEFKQAFKNLTGKDYNENAVKNFLAQAQKGGDWSKSYDQAFGDKVVKRATDKVNFQQYVDGAGDIVLMLLGTEAIGKGVAWAGSKVATKLAPYVPKVLSKIGASTVMKIGGNSVTVSRVAGSMATSAATFTTWDASKNYINLKTKDIQYTGEDAVKEWQAYKEGNVESGKFGAFAGLLNSTVVGKVVNGTMKLFEKPVAKAIQGVTKTLEKGEVSGADVMKTFMAKQTPGMLAKTAGIVAEVSGFTMYETANNLTKKLLQTDANGQLHLPKDLTEEGLTQYLLKNIPEEFLKQAKGIGEIKAISKLIFMHKGAIAERERMINESLSKCEMLNNVKVQKAEVNGTEIYVITTPNGNRKIARSPEDVVAYCNILMQMDMAMNSKVMAEETKPKGKLAVEENNVKSTKELIEKAQTTNPTENVKNKVISEVAKDIKDEGMRLNTPESLDAELAEVEQNPNAPVDNMEAFNLVINGKIGNVLKAQYDNASKVFTDIAKKYSLELDQLEKQYGNDKKLFAEKFTEFLADKLGVKGIEPKIVLRDTGDADGFFDWSTGELAVNSKLNNSKDIQTMIAHEFVHVMQFKDMIANRGAEAVSSLLMHDTKFITAKAIELAKNNGADYKSLPVEEQQIYKEVCSEMLADEVMEANKGLVDFAQKNPISKGSLNEYLSRIYQNEYENMKTDINSPEYYNQVIENEAYYLGNGQLGLNLKGSIHFANTKTEQIRNIGVNVPKGVVQSEIKLSERQQKLYDKYHADVKKVISNSLSGDNLERANKLYDMLKDHIVMVKERSYSPKIEASDIIEISRNPNIDFARLENIVKHLDPNDEINLGFTLRKVMELSNEDFGKITDKLGEYSNDIRILYSISQNKSANLDRIKLFLDQIKISDDKSDNSVVYSLESVSELSDEAWDNVIKRDIIKILSDTHASYFNGTLQSLANLDNKTWDLVNKRNLINHNALRNIDVLASLSDKDFQKLIQLNIFNPTTGNLRVGEKYLSEFTNLTREQEAKLEKYNLLDRDNSQSSAKGFVGNINGSQVLAILDAPKEEFQKLVDKNLFDIKVNDRLLKTDEIIALGDSEPDVINKVINILSINPEINIKEAMVISELSKEDIAKIQKYNLFEEKVAPRLLSSNVDGETVLMLSAFKNAKNGGAKEFVKLRPAEVIKVAQQSEESIPKLLKLLKNENIEKYSFDDLIKIAKLNDTEFEKVETIVNENKEDGNYLLAYSLNENGDNATFNEISYNQVKEFNKILDDPAYADVFIRYCANEDGTHNAEVGNKLINLLKETHDSRLISAIVEIAKENKKQSIDPRFFDALEDAKNRGVSLHTFDLILKECTDVNGNFSQEIYNKIYELRDAQIWEGGIPQILKACKNNDGTFNDEVFKTAFKLKEMGHSIDRIGFVLQASKDQKGNFNSSLLERIHKEVYNWNANDFPKIIQLCLNEKGSLNEVAYENLRELQATGRFSQTDIVELVPLLNVACECSGKNNINELSIAEKRKLLKNLVSLNAQLFNKQFKLATESLNLNTSVIPTSKEEYCSLLPKLVKSIGIDTKPLSQDVKSKYQTSIDALSKEDGALAKTNFNTGDIKLELAYPRETFISDMNNLLNELPPLERVKAMDYFGFEIKNRSDNVAQMNGYPINVNNGAKMSEISEPATKAVIEKMRPYVERFTNQNHISIKDNPALADELNNIVKAFPEFLTTIGRKQHGTHDYTIDVHTLKVLQGVITNPRFQQLPSADRKILQIATLMHDLTKAEGLVDKTHPQYSAYDTYYLLEKMNLSESDKLKVYQLIKNHDWLERLNTAGRNTEAVARDIAFDLREGNSFEMASILAEADLKGVKKNDSFYLKYQDALDRGNAKIKELVDEMQKSSIYLPQTKLPKASEIKIDGEKVKIENTKDSNGNPISNTVIYLDKDMDLSTLGFAEGLKSSDLNVLVHALNYENQSAIFQALGQVDSDALLSSSYVTYNKGNYHVFRTQGFILDVASTDIHAGTYMDFGSGCGKDMQTLKSQYLFNGNRKDLRNFFSDEFKEMLNLTDEEYLKLYNEISDKSITELDKSHPEVAKKIREMFDSMEIHKRSLGRDYNEILISRPQIQGVFWQGKVKDSDAEKHLGKKYTIDRVPEFLRKYAEENNLPIIYFGE